MSENKRRAWAVDTPGVPHSPRQARINNFNATSGETGLIAAGGGGVIPTPGVAGSVRVVPCSVVAESRYTGDRGQSYQWEIEDSVDVAVPNTGSTGGRRDLVVTYLQDHIREGVTIEERDETGEITKEGADPAELDFWDVTVLQGAPNTVDPENLKIWAETKFPNRSPVVPLAVVNRGANATTVTASQITNVFELANARTHTARVYYDVASLSDVVGRVTNYQTFGPTLTYEVPHWATRAEVTCTINGMLCRNGSSTGKLSGLAMATSMREARWDMDMVLKQDGSGTYQRATFTVFGVVDIHASRRGTVQDFKLRATNHVSGTGFGVNSGSQIKLEVAFYEDPKAVDIQR